MMLLIYLKNNSSQKKRTGQKKKHGKWEAKREVMLVLINQMGKEWKVDQIDLIRNQSKTKFKWQKTLTQWFGKSI